LAIPKSTLYTWRTRRAGFGPRAVKVGGSLRYRRSDLDAWIEAHLESLEDSGEAPDPRSDRDRGMSLSRASGPRW
jgi:hypothetical protein